MPHSKQAKKRLRQSVKKRDENQSIKSAMKTHVKKVLQAVEKGDADAAKERLPLAVKKIDKASKRNVIHKNQASRKVARLSRKVAQLEKEKGASSDDA